MTAAIMTMFLSSKWHKKNKTEPWVDDKEEPAMLRKNWSVEPVTKVYACDEVEDEQHVLLNCLEGYVWGAESD